MSYPENIPPDSKVTMDTFNFSFALAKELSSEMYKEYEALSERIDNIVESEKFYVAGMPVLRSILSLNPSSNDLKKLAKALARLSELTERHSEVGSKFDLIKTAVDNPHWFVTTFGDFSKDVDQAIDSIFKDIED